MALQRNIGVLHPGAMGATVAQTLLDSGHQVGWVSANRSVETARRARGCMPFDSLDEIAAWADALISVCPPHGAVELAERVHAMQFTGFYVDANALAPSTSLQIAEIIGTVPMWMAALSSPQRSMLKPPACICPGSMGQTWPIGSALER